MKKAMIWTAAVSFLAFVIIWGMMGLNIMNGEYDSVTVMTWIGVVCMIMLLIQFFSWNISAISLMMTAAVISVLVFVIGDCREKGGEGR